MVGAAPGGGVVVAGHREGVEILGLQAHRFLRKPEHLAQLQIALHVAVENIDIAADLGPVLQRQALLEHGLEEHLLRLHAALVVIALGIIVVVAPAHQAHGLLAVELLQARLKVDLQILPGVLIVHLTRHIHLHAADEVHDLHKGFQIDLDVIVGRKSDELFEVRFQSVHTQDAVHRVDLLDVPLDVDHCVARDAHQAQILVGHVVGDDHDRVGIALALIRTQHKEGIKILLALAGEGGLLRRHSGIVRCADRR